MEKSYKLTLTERQGEVVKEACNLYANLLRGNLNPIFDNLPYREGFKVEDFDYPREHLTCIAPIVDYLSVALPEVLTDDIDGFRTCLPFDHPSLRDEASISQSLALAYASSSSALTKDLSLEESQILSRACDVYARTLMGQFNESMDNLPMKKGADYGKFWQIKDFVRTLLPGVLIHGIDGWASSLGVGSPDLNPKSNIAVDIHQVIRHRLAWDRAVKDKIVESVDSPRKWPQMIQVFYDTPFHWGSEPLCSFAPAT